MNSIAFIDTEINPNNNVILDIGGIKANGISFHSSSVNNFTDFIKGSEYICGHNIIHHDLKYIKNALSTAGISSSKIIDTLYLSPLLFPMKPYHALLKDDKLQTDEANNPLNDSIKARDLFFDEVSAFQYIDDPLKQIYYFLLQDQPEFGAFFRFLDYKPNTISIENLIYKRFNAQICEHANLLSIISYSPIELAYCLALINTNNRYSITPPWVLKNYPKVENVMFLLRNKPCLEGCPYCNDALDIRKGLKRFFGFDSYRTYAGEPLQEKAAQAAVDSKSLLAVFPTGGGKSITFQVPALMSGINNKGLTIVISPLQSLMKDQVDNLERVGITDAVTINGLLDPIERAKSFERVENGSASILYLSPESLRSRSIESLLLKRNLVRFVIDEAHCFSSWGQDFRVDYIYIGDFIKSIQEQKGMEENIPVSCFTATAKPKVIEDICQYFKQKLSLNLEIFTSKASRTNLRYQVFERQSEEDKYSTVRDLIQENQCPTIIYVSRTKKAYGLAERLINDGYQAKPYHGQMDKLEKSRNQDAFINGDVNIMVATSAFGMGVDKKDVGMVIHYEISDSLENYIQEAGRAGRDENISADCYVLYNDEDLSKHFTLLNQTKLSMQEIQQVWKAVRDITRFRASVSQSAREIAKKAGWDEGLNGIETRVTTAIAALEDAGYLKRTQNMPRVFADGIIPKNTQEAIARINTSSKFDEKQKEQAARIISYLFSRRSTKTSGGSSSRVDDISDHLGIPKAEVIHVVNLLRMEKVLADTKDLTVFIRKKQKKNNALRTIKVYSELEKYLLHCLQSEQKTYPIKEINEQAQAYGCRDVTPNKINAILNLWTITNWIQKHTADFAKNYVLIRCLYEPEVLEEKLANLHALAQSIGEYLYDIIEKNPEELVSNGDEVLIQFSLAELKNALERRSNLFNKRLTLSDVEDALFYMSRIEAINIEGGFMVVYNPMTIERLEKDNKKRYKVEDYQKLNQFYQNRIQQIHIVGEYARKMIEDYKAALEFVNDYFQLNYNPFLNKYFRGSRQNEIQRNITPAKFKQLFGQLSPTQLKIINDKDSKYIVVAAGPGSGKTRILVHKLASLLLMEDIKHEQLLMLTFSRAAVTEFKKRLLKLIGSAANFVEIKTFHSYCFDLLGRVGTLEKSDQIIYETIQRIKTGEVDPSRITKTVLVIDEAQDMDGDEFALINALMEYNEEMRVIAVGDDDQNIFEFRGASSKYLLTLIKDNNATMYELVENYRSKSNLVDYANQFVTSINNRIKRTPIMAAQPDNGKIKLVSYKSNNLIVPLVRDIVSAELAGSTCILTETNDEALQITGLLMKNGLPAKLIRANEGFNLYNLLEIRWFLNKIDMDQSAYTISDDVWAEAKRGFRDRFINSPNLETCTSLIEDFEATNPRIKYRSDLDVFIRESKLEDFSGENNETIFVSTIHKSKGREFDNLYILLNQFNPTNDEARRQLYVGMTRAKGNLNIHYNGKYLDYITTEDLQLISDSEAYSPPAHLAMQLTYKDVWLDYFISRQNLISLLNSGDKLRVDGEGCSTMNGVPILRFSKLFSRQIEALGQKNYHPLMARIRFIVHWKKEGSAEEIMIVLPELYLEHTGHFQKYSSEKSS